MDASTTPTITTSTSTSDDSDKHSTGKSNCHVSRDEIQYTLAKAVELRALHAAVMQGTSPASTSPVFTPVGEGFVERFLVLVYESIYYVVYGEIEWDALMPIFRNRHVVCMRIQCCKNRRTQLWLEKIGAIEPFAGNLATCWNNIKEEEAVERYKLITGNSVLFPEFQVYGEDKCDWLAASPDGVVDYHVYGLPSGGLLEIKCPFFGGDMRIASPWYRIPLYHIPQAQGLMEIMDRDWMDFYVWTPKESSLFRMYRDLDYWDAMKVALSDFWLDNVEPARAVYKQRVSKEPLYELRAFRPNSRHELCSYIVQESKHIVDNSRLLVREINGILQMGSITRMM
ncbi:hypothetical protein QQ045_015641 [Rhodiola kirilowii]